MLGSFHDAEEATQETLLRAWSAHGNYEARPPSHTGCTGSPPRRADHDVLRLDLALGLDAADVDVADAQYRVVAHGSSDGLGDLGIGSGAGWTRSLTFSAVARASWGSLGHRRHDLLHGGATVTREEHVLATAQRHGDGRRLAWSEVERRQAHRAVERVTPGAPLLRRERDASLPQRAQGRARRS